MRDRVDALILRLASRIFERRGWLGKHATPDSCYTHLRYRARVLRP